MNKMTNTIDNISKTCREKAKLYSTNLYLNPETYNEDKAEGYENGFIDGFKEGFDVHSCLDVQPSYDTLNKIVNILIGYLDDTEINYDDDNYMAVSYVKERLNLY